MAYVLPYYLILYGMLLFAKKAAHVGGRSAAFLALIFLMLTIINSSRFIDPEGLNYSFAGIFNAGVKLSGGGVFGTYAGNVLVKLTGKSGLFIFSFVVILASLLLVINTPISQFLDSLKLKRAERREKKAGEAWEEPAEGSAAAAKPPAAKPPAAPPLAGAGRPEQPLPAEPEEAAAENGAPRKSPFDELYGGMSVNQMKIMDYMSDDNLFEKTEAANRAVEEFSKAEEAAEAKPPIAGGAKLSKPATAKYQLPSIEFLNKGIDGSRLNSDAGLMAKAGKLEETLSNFHVDAKVLRVTQGPAVTRYEIQPNTGVKVNSIVRLADDIALNLEARSIRIEAPIPGKAAVGIEVENDKVTMVTLRDILASKEFKDSKSKIAFAIGKDISGNSIVADLKEMPHMLIAGATGSGKSVCINSIIISILYKALPEEVKLVLIDPKVVELRNYNGIPHLLIPVVTEPPKAAAALGWAVSEMTDRYKKFAEEGVRDLDSYNGSVRKRNENDMVLPQIVIIIDELADLMMAAPSQVEESICRLAQMARAAGMHLIVATQRPSVDIITGVIKANIPSRIAFAVSSQFDSRTILDMSGAEKLVGKGDMLFNPIGIPKPVRVQGTFISDSEVHRVIEFVKSQSKEVEYADDVIHTIEKGDAEGSQGGDELLDEAIETVVKTKQASASGLQRRFRIGYNRAARIIEIMEAKGIISRADGSKPRQVLMTEEELYEAGNEKKGLE
ncbi:MAG: DNA translocase FtsK [Clostridiales bacterium]|nr:DNA translocase FtsK [Clostridiales bacterium]